MNKKKKLNLTKQLPKWAVLENGYYSTGGVSHYWGKKYSENNPLGHKAIGPPNRSTMALQILFPEIDIFYPSKTIHDVQIRMDARDHNNPQETMFMDFNEEKLAQLIDHLKDLQRAIPLKAKLLKNFSPFVLDFSYGRDGDGESRVWDKLFRIMIRKNKDSLEYILVEVYEEIIQLELIKTPEVYSDGLGIVYIQKNTPENQLKQFANGSIIPQYVSDWVRETAQKNHAQYIELHVVQTIFK